jgi:hypothetical protein
VAQGNKEKEFLQDLVTAFAGANSQRQLHNTMVNACQV